jgi:exopolyphosphatase/guanosine-5'-triphosphate,3'-diphosphate pyrophosphatase
VDCAVLARGAGVAADRGEVPFVGDIDISSRLVRYSRPIIDRLSSAKRSRRDFGARENRSPEHGAELFDWMTPLFPKETAAERRIREAACLFSDIGWRRHPDDRAMGAFHQVLRGAYGGADHRERAVMATAVYYRYVGDDNFPEDAGVGGLLGAEGAVQALRIGLAARLAYGLAAAIEGELPLMALQLSKETLALEIPEKRKALLTESVHKRLTDLAEAFGRKGAAVVV